MKSKQRNKNMQHENQTQLYQQHSGPGLVYNCFFLVMAIFTIIVSGISANTPKKERKTISSPAVNVVPIIRMDGDGGKALLPVATAPPSHPTTVSIPQGQKMLGMGIIQFPNPLLPPPGMVYYRNPDADSETLLAKLIEKVEKRSPAFKSNVKVTVGAMGTYKQAIVVVPDATDIRGEQFTVNVVMDETGKPANMQIVRQFRTGGAAERNTVTYESLSGFAKELILSSGEKCLDVAIRRDTALGILKKCLAAVEDEEARQSGASASPGPSKPSSLAPSAAQAKKS